MTAAPPKTNLTAIIAFAAGLLGFTCLWGIGGIAAIVLGATALREVERSEGREHGRTLARVAIALGVLNVAALIVGIGVGIALLVRPDKPVATRPAPAPPTLTAPSLPPGHPPLPGAGSEPLRSPRALGTRELRVGKVRLVDLNPGGGGLGKALSTQRGEAAAAKERVLVFTVSADCEPCNGVALALGDARMQQALAATRLVRVDVADYATELTALHVPIDTVPGFALLGDDGRVSDFIHGGEWGADIAENIAPVLGAFVRGKYEKRRERFRGPARPDETAL